MLLLRTLPRYRLRSFGLAAAASLRADLHVIPALKSTLSRYCECGTTVEPPGQKLPAGDPVAIADGTAAAEIEPIAIVATTTFLIFITTPFSLFLDVGPV
jgi:hypothetical protein